MAENLLYYGDNLDVLRRYVKDESVDLLYLDPPFNSNADYNVLFAEKDGARAAAQIKAFKDTWHWDQSAALAYEDFVVGGPQHASQAVQAFRSLLGENDMLAYLAMMAPRLVELRRVLKPTGSIYLHCDPTASHYLKLLMDAVFGPRNFRNEIVWKRTSTHSSAKKCGPVHDILLFYTRSDAYTWNPQHDPHVEDLRARHDLSNDEAGRLFRMSDMTGAGTRNGSSGRPWRVFNPTEIGRHWITTVEKLEELAQQGLVYFPRDGKWPRLIRYQDESKGRAIGDVWDNIPPINAKAAERLGYPTQKPEALLDRIIRAGSNEGDTVLDPFCGCGTAVAVAQRLGRRWIGIDITHLAIGLIKTRLIDTYGDSIAKTYKVFGEPVSLPDARALAVLDRYQFQYWALGLVGARPTPADQKKGAGKGVDGRLYFHDDAETGKTKQVVFSVKSGTLKADDVRALGHVLARENGEIGVLITMQAPTQPMRTDAASAGFYSSPWGTKHPRLQILTIEDLLGNRKVDMPPSLDFRTFKKAPKAKKKPDTTPLDLEFDDES